jgi:hypothetical protein
MTLPIQYQVSSRSRISRSWYLLKINPIKIQSANRQVISYNHIYRPHQPPHPHPTVHVHRLHEIR